MLPQIRIETETKMSISQRISKKQLQESPEMSHCSTAAIFSCEIQQAEAMAEPKAPHASQGLELSSPQKAEMIANIR